MDEYVHVFVIDTVFVASREFLNGWGIPGRHHWFHYFMVIHDLDDWCTPTILGNLQVIRP